MTYFRKLPFWTSIVLIVAMAVATALEKQHGSEFVYTHVYGAWWFVYLWTVLAALGIMGIVKGRIYKNLPLMFVHLSFVVILSGAALTKAFAEQGRIIITKNVYTSFVEGEERPMNLPFGIRLDTFFISYYPGTDAPADYTSQITILEKSHEPVQAQISMNKIYSHKNYRFYQASFGNDMNTSILRVNHDVLGVPVSYAGYYMFMLSMLWLLLARGNIFRQLLQHPLLQKTALTIVAIAMLGQASAQTFRGDGLTVDKAQAEAFGNLWILNEGRIMPVFSFAHEFTQKITGKHSFGDMDATQFLAGILFCPEQWDNLPLLEVENPELCRALNLKGDKAALSDFYEGDTYKLSRYGIETNAPAKSALTKEVEKLNDKLHLIEMLNSGTILQIFPTSVDGRLQWLYPNQQIPAESIDVEDHKFAALSLVYYYSELKKGDSAGALKILDKIRAFQERNAGATLPSETHRQAERLHTRVDFNAILFKVNLTCGLLALVLLLFLSAKGQRRGSQIFHALLVASFLVQTGAIALRTYIAGRLPFSNGYETMLLTAWCAMLIAVFWGRKIRLLIPFGFLLSGCTLLVAHIGSMNPKITPLVPVLSSPLLSIHVSVIMLSYTLFGFVALNSLTTFARILTAGKNSKEAVATMLERNKIYSLICLYPALFLLGSGIFIGAIWANVSWGRYWGWDPKEVWALITFMIYGLIFHRHMKIMNNAFVFHVFGLYAFASVLMTYFGVNYLLGGMHSYAGEMQTGQTALITGIALVAVTVFVIATRLKLRIMSVIMNYERNYEL